jgi:predicted DNA-binding protein (MmcQ/YjbR family)
MNKMFCLLNLEYPQSVNLKCDPERAVTLREEYEDIIPGWHMNKKHWNTLQLTGTLKNSMMEELIDHSYDLVVKSLKKKDRENLEKSE